MGDRALCRIPGMCAKLEDSWESPYKVVEQISPVNYRENGKGKMKTIHVNSTGRGKSFIGSVCMLAEEQDTIPDEPIFGKEMCAGLDKKVFYQIFAEFEEDVLSGKLGNYNLKEIYIVQLPFHSNLIRSHTNY